MWLDLVPLLRCPSCGSSIALTSATERQGDAVIAGTLTCTLRHEYQIIRGVPRFVDADAYADSFSRQRLYVRKHFDHYRHDRSGYSQFYPTTGFTKSELADGLTLEIGAGYGRFADVVSTDGGTYVGVDLSTHSIDLAYDYLGGRRSVHLVQADLFRLPFAPGTFARLFSIGVLHHTPNTEHAFKAVAPFVRPGGRVAIWVYHPSRKTSANRWRVVTARLPHPVLYAWCVANQALFSWIRALPGSGVFNQVVPGVSPGPGRPFWMRVLGDFDSLSPRYAYVHTQDEVSRWFAEAGMTDVLVLDRPTAVSGRRPDLSTS